MSGWRQALLGKRRDEKADLRRELQLMVMDPMLTPKPFDPADHRRRQAAHDMLAVRVLSKQIRANTDPEETS